MIRIRTTRKVGREGWREGGREGDEKRREKMREMLSCQHQCAKLLQLFTRTCGLVLPMAVRTAASVSFPFSPTRFATASLSKSTITRASSTVKSCVKLSSSEGNGSGFRDTTSMLSSPIALVGANENEPVNMRGKI